MDYYGYFPTFDFLVIETYIIATLIGFIAIFFIFWFSHKYNTVTKNKTKKISDDDKFKLSITTIIFMGIILFGMILLIGNLDTLHREPASLENLSIQTENIVTIPKHIENNLNFIHTLFKLWTIFSFIYIVALIFSLDIFEFEIKKEPKKEVKKKTKLVKKNVRKNKKSTGGK